MPPPCKPPTALRFYAIGLVGYSAVKVLAPAFYALDRRNLPMLVSLFSIGLNFFLNWIFTLHLGFGHRGLALSTSLVAMTNFLLLYFMMRHYAGDLESGVIFPTLGKLALAGAVLAAICWLGMHIFFANGIPQSFVQRLLGVGHYCGDRQCGIFRRSLPAPRRRIARPRRSRATEIAAVGFGIDPAEFSRQNRGTKFKGIQVALSLTVTLAVLKAEPASSPTASISPALPHPTLGVVFTVNSTGDGDNKAAAGVCDDGSDHCTLRAAIQAANNISGLEDTIEFAIPTNDAGYDPATGRYTIVIGSSLPDVATNMAIEGSGADKLTVKTPGPVTYRIFRVTTPGAASFSGMTIDSGMNGNFDPVADGGGIQNLYAGTLTIAGCRFTNNFGGYGGAIATYDRPGKHTASTFENNSAFVGGGALASGPGAVTVSGSTFTNNTSFHGIGGGSGGGIYTTGVLTVTNCTFNKNAGRGGAAITNVAGTVEVRNSTFAGNSPVSPGSGTLESEGGTLTLVNCTITGNDLTNSLNGGAGGVYSIRGNVIVQNTIIAGNTATGFEVAPDVSGSFISNGNNIIGKTDGIPASRTQAITPAHRCAA